MIRRLVLVAAATAALATSLVATPAAATMPHATMPHVVAPATMPHATMPHVQAPATMPHATMPHVVKPHGAAVLAAPARVCGPIRWTTWGAGQVCYQMYGGSSVWSARVHDRITDGSCVEMKRLNNITGQWVNLSPRVRECTTGQWSGFIQLGTAHKPTSGARIVAHRYACVPLPPGWGGCY